MARTRTSVVLVLAGAALLACGPLSASGDLPPPENVVEAMSVKLLRGVVNVVTCPVEIPRQLRRQIGMHGPVFGPCVGLLTGIGMTGFRGAAGAIEAVMFLVPQPGFYEPLIEPAFVWEGWDEPSHPNVAPRLPCWPGAAPSAACQPAAAPQP